MAKVIYGSIVTGISGSVGGNVFAKAANGSYIKRKGAVINKRSSLQLVRRNQFVSVTSSWRSIGSTAQATWVTLAAATPYVNSLGMTVYYTGFQLFSKYNNQLITTDNTPIETAPAPFIFTDYVWAICTAYSDGSGMNLQGAFTLSTTTEVPYSCNLQLYATPPLSSGVLSPKPSNYRDFGAIPSGSYWAGINLSGLYLQTFGTYPIAGSNIFWKAFLVNTYGGQVAPPVVSIMSIS